MESHISDGCGVSAMDECDAERCAVTEFDRRVFGAANDETVVERRESHLVNSFSVRRAATQYDF